ncbi:MAG: ATP-binding protein [Saccharospirillum sp.]
MNWAAIDHTAGWGLLTLGLAYVVVSIAIMLYQRRRMALSVTTLQRVTNRLDGFVYRCRNDPDRSVLFMSEGSVNLTGYPAQDFVRGKRHFANQIHPDDQQRVWDEVQFALAGHRTFRVHYRTLDRLGAECWCYEEGCGVFDAEGELLYLEGLVLNDDERYEAEAAQRRMQAMVEASPQAMGWADPDGTVRFFNKALRKLLGMSEGAAVSGYKLRDFYETKAYHRLETKVLPTVVAQGTWVGEIELTTLDGNRVPTLHSVFALHDTVGEVLAFANVITDLREIRAVERDLHVKEAAIASATSAIALAGLDGAVTYVNQAFVSLWGLSSPEEAIGRSVLSFWEAPDRAQAVVNSLSQDGRWQGELVARRADGSRMNLELVAHMVLGEDGNPICMMASFLDVTARLQFEAELRELNQSLEQRVQQRTAELERANQAKSEFLSRMSHELRTPLNVILGFSQLLQEPNADSASSPSADYASEIYKSGQHLLELVNDVLDLAKVESGKLELLLEPMRVAPEIKQCAEQIALCAQKRNIDIQMHDGHNFTVLADPLRFRQVLLNLLSNAVKYNREGGRVVLECSEQPSGWMRLSVSDTGRGMSAEQQARLFRPFERFVSPYEGIDGTGIGLSLCKYLVEAMQGRIGVRSTEGKGTTLWFELPLQAPGKWQATPNQMLPDTDTPENTLPTIRSEGTYRILCIEDNPGNLLLIQRAFKTRSDWVLHSAVSAEDGLDLAEQIRPDLILLDINLPDMSGYEALEILKRHQFLHSVPVIAVTANAMPSDIERGWSAGFSDYITKPFRVRDLFGAIDALLPTAGVKS